MKTPAGLSVEHQQMDKSGCLQQKETTCCTQRCRTPSASSCPNSAFKSFPLSFLWERHLSLYTIKPNSCTYAHCWFSFALREARGLVLAHTANGVASQAAPVSNCHMLGVNQGSVKKKKEVRRWFICDGGGCRLMRFLARVLQVSGCQWERGNHANPLVSSVPPRKVHHHKLCPFKWKWPGDERCKQICRWRIGCTWAIFPPGSPLCLCAVLRSLSDPYSAVAAQQKKGRVTRGTRAIS